MEVVGHQAIGQEGNLVRSRMLFEKWGKKLKSPFGIEDPFSVHSPIENVKVCPFRLQESSFP
jgi:hypothetical protein